MDLVGVACLVRLPPGWAVRIEIAVILVKLLSFVWERSVTSGPFAEVVISFLGAPIELFGL